MNKLNLLLGVALAFFAAHGKLAAQTPPPSADTNTPAWLTRPLSLADTLNVALAQNATMVLTVVSGLHYAWAASRRIAAPAANGSGVR